MENIKTLVIDSGFFWMQVELSILLAAMMGQLLRQWQQTDDIKFVPVLVTQASDIPSNS